jgi:hypothetical protein
VRPSFDEVTPDAGDEAAFAELESGIVDQIERAATNAFSLPFLAAAAFALLALVPITSLRERRR